MSDIQTDLFLLLLRRKAEGRGGYVTLSDVEETFWDLSTELKIALNRAELSKSKRAHALVRQHLLPGIVVTAQLSGITVREESTT